MRFFSLLPAVVCACVAGCAGYRLGPTNGTEAGSKTVQVTPFLNHSTEPGLADEVTSQVRKSVQRDGTFRLATHGDADLIVTGVITSYSRRPVSLTSGDLRSVSDYQVVVTAQVVIRERSTGKILTDKIIKGDGLLVVGSDLGAAQRQLTPELATSLARGVTRLLVDGSW